MVIVVMLDVFEGQQISTLEWFLCGMISAPVTAAVDAALVAVSVLVYGAFAADDLTLALAVVFQHHAPFERPHHHFRAWFRQECQCPPFP